MYIEIHKNKYKSDDIITQNDVPYPKNRNPNNGAIRFTY